MTFLNLNFFLCLPCFFPPRALSQSFPPFCVVFKFYVPTFCTLPGLLFTSLSAFTMSLGLERGIVLSCREFCRPLGGDKTYAPVGVSYPNDRLALPSLGTLGVVVSGERRRPSTLLKKRYNKQKLSTHSFQNTQDNQNFPKHSRSTKISKHSRLFCFVVLLRSLSCCLFFSQCLSPCVSPCLCPSMCLFLPVCLCLCLCHCLSFFVSLSSWYSSSSCPSYALAGSVPFASVTQVRLFLCLSLCLLCLCLCVITTRILYQEFR